MIDGRCHRGDGDDDMGNEGRRGSVSVIHIATWGGDDDGAEGTICVER